MLKNLNIDKALFILHNHKDPFELSLRNIKGIEISYVENINTYQIIKYPKLVLTKEVVERLSEVYKE
jgi:large subunit ribosomal protein L4